MKKSHFIAFEGIDGSGKSTQSKLLAEKLKQEGFKIYSTFEPTDSPIGSVIKNIFRHRIEADHRTIAGLYVADRLDHLLNKTNGILMKMEEGYTVVTDRYYFSSYAYQGTHMSLDWVIQANSLSAELLRPDLTIFIDVPPDVCMQRLSEGRDMIQLYESLDNLHNVRKKYFEAFDKLKDLENIFIVDGNRPFDAIANDVWNKVYPLFKSQASVTPER
jgi:dTMP kinase